MNEPMKRIRSIDHLKALHEELVGLHDPYIPTLVVPAGTCCQASGANALIRTAKRELLKRKLTGKIRLRVTGCHGFCAMEPSILVEPRRTFYPRIRPDDVITIIEAVANSDVVTGLLFADPGTGERIEIQDDIPFFKKQKRSIMGRNEKIDPVRIQDYIRNDGYLALAKVLARQEEQQFVLDEVKTSALRGRGGAGFSTGQKWELFASQKNGNAKYLICNADEGDPGAYMDRSVLEGNPHSIIEGMIIGAYGTEATEGIIYVRTEYPLAIKHLKHALKQAEELGLLGENILGTGFSFNIGIVKGAGAFVCGEETALIRSIEGRMGEPRQRPPFPIVKGLYGKPTMINNVETWANIPLIISGGGKLFAKVGTPGNSGTKIFSLVGKIKNTGLAEVPMGMTLGEVVRNIGGGPVGKREIKAVQTGGPSGGCIPAAKFDLPIEYETLKGAGSIMGSGGMIVMDDSTCMVDVAKYFMGFLKDESCGKCFTCRKGTQRMHEILEDITLGKGTPEHLALLEELAQTVKDTTMCGLGQSASNPVLSTLKYFREEYERHINDKRCDAFVCKQLTGAPCQAACPVDTEPWRYVALVEKGEYEEAYRVIRSANPFPAVSSRVCDRKCEHRCGLGASGGEAISIRALKRFVTDRVDPAVYRPEVPRGKTKEVAVIGAGPAGLTAAHYLSLLGYKVTVFEAEDQPGGMLTCSLPAYRLPRQIVDREIESLLNENITIEYGRALGKDMTIQGLLADRFKAIFLAIGAHESRRLDLENEDVDGIFPSMQFLKAFNMKGEELARGRVGIVGGGNSAVDAARVALRQKDVTSVSLFYRRTRDEMPAYEEEIEAALEEGVRIETLISPVKIHARQEEIEAAIREGVELETLVSPIRIHSNEGRLVSVECVRNRLGEVDATGRRKPVPVPGSEFKVKIDTLIVAIGEKPQSESLASMGLNTDKSGRIRVNNKTLETSLKGVFAGGDLVTGPNTVIDAIAAGKKAAQSIDRYLRNEQLTEPAASKLPRVFVEPAMVDKSKAEAEMRAVPPLLAPTERIKNFLETEKTLSEDQARTESRRCLRCDLAFTGETSTGKPATS
ncbi:MAG: NADP-reducing hydrogenase subunit HndC [Syntrophorhabdus sp. PtaU1.Bin002]|nr:MAG: NADP-reducing hydrogenase subunit HndC [Syntrophorhabdus sp. PtaU1.Bin002]